MTNGYWNDSTVDIITTHWDSHTITTHWISGPAYIIYISDGLSVDMHITDYLGHSTMDIRYIVLWISGTLFHGCLGDSTQGVRLV